MGVPESLTRTDVVLNYNGSIIRFHYEVSDDCVIVHCQGASFRMPYDTTPPGKTQVQARLIFELECGLLSTPLPRAGRKISNVRSPGFFELVY